MRLDHFVLNIDKKYQQDQTVVAEIQKFLPYMPKWGKGTAGFKVSNIWIGKEYLEMVHIRKAHGGGWISKWTELYNNGHRGMICLMLDVENIDTLYQFAQENQIAMSEPKWLDFKWFFNLLTRRMPWRNSYLPFFENVPFQIGFQEMKDNDARKFMEQYMVPNASEQGISGISEVVVSGLFTDEDFAMLDLFFAENIKNIDKNRQLTFATQRILFKQADCYTVELQTSSDRKEMIEIENVTIFL